MKEKRQRWCLCKHFTSEKQNQVFIISTQSIYTVCHNFSMKTGIAHAVFSVFSFRCCKFYFVRSCMLAPFSIMVLRPIISLQQPFAGTQHRLYESLNMILHVLARPAASSRTPGNNLRNCIAKKGWLFEGPPRRPFVCKFPAVPTGAVCPGPRSANALFGAVATVYRLSVPSRVWFSTTTSWQNVQQGISDSNTLKVRGFRVLSPFSWGDRPRIRPSCSCVLALATTAANLKYCFANLHSLKDASGHFSLLG